VEAYIDHTRYDLMLFLQPDVRWVADGKRLNGEQKKRMELSKRLKNMYEYHGFGDKMVVVAGDYAQRLAKAIELVDRLMGGEKA
jgi:HTH-type transcriptional repressor of NAD biosynthesis genes